ncbi:hypothetical protein WBG78_15790 [Chryseolinea sp. T2]|uniref:hypothetical protein n=1 Tax=Chryseolinea sp. T2 TaxID=3129255 RepID=UPI0030770622
MQWKDERLKKITDKSDSIQQAIRSKLDNLPLPPELRDKANQVLQEISSVQSPLSRDLQGNIRSIGNLIPGVNEKIQSIATLGSDLRRTVSLQNLDALGNIEPSAIPSRLQQITDMSSIPKVGEMNVENLSETAQQQLSKTSVGSSVQEQIGQGSQVASMISKAGDEQAVKEQMLQHVQHEAVDHFAGRTAQLEEAIAKLEKFKRKFENAEDITKLPKRVPNPMRERRFVQRLLPGLSFQMSVKGSWMIDINPYLGYKVSGRTLGGLGWNQRICYTSSSNHGFSSDQSFFGPRIYGEFLIAKGFSARAESEFMKVIVPSKFSSGNVDTDGREWVFGALIGINKSYRILKRINGTAMLMYNLYNPDNRSPYKGRLCARVGIEIQPKNSKKKVKS